jgi:hypothetical protein
MSLFRRKKKDVENKKVDMTEIFKDTILQEALKENVDKQNKIIDLENNMDFLYENLDLIREKCKKNNRSKLAKEILDMIGTGEEEDESSNN